MNATPSSTQHDIQMEHTGPATLADVMIEYAQDWESHLRSAVNHRPRAGYVRRIQLAGDVAGVLSMLTRDAEAAVAELEAASR